MLRAKSRCRAAQLPPGTGCGALARVTGWVADRRRAARRRWLLDRHGGADALEDGLRLLRGLLVDFLQDLLRRGVDHVLGLLQAEAGQRPHHLDDLDLLVPSCLEDHVELV